ncbi:AMP-dependent synthetase/ligase [Micropruina sonneratiae]|uniref:AMP-dependent synthetase/ligase n=1 Tax=Micropruina sonneratiae TaxID=2986940 RepID=UPI002225EDC9|nr:long-chain fatty acid--CoA ligase [Micropruina sp. KQZ13P-5]MCW3158235.1 long-chain fatty acid--CoA ligase [Micropruina sp. KQZ13P-5]
MNAEAEAILAGKPRSVGDLLNWRTEKTPQAEAFRYPDGDDNWQSWTWTETRDRVHEVAAGLLTIGVGREERVAIAAQTRIEWVLMDLAIMAIGAATTTIYPNTAAQDFQYIVEHSASKVLVAETAEQAAKLDPGSDGVRAVVLIDGEGDGERTLSWQQLIERGRQRLSEEPGCVDAARDGVGLDHLATLIYTSGTTGRPKGVELTQRNWIYEGFAVDELKIIDFEDLQYLWLPLSHVFGKCLIAIQLAIGFTTAVDGRVDRIVHNLGVTKPTFMCGAPRIFEKVRATVLSSGLTGLRGTISRWAFTVGKQCREYRLAGRPLPALLGVQYKVADRLVYSKLRERLGGRMRFMVSGSAKLNEKVQGWFYSAGLIIIEGYGLTETTAVSFVNVPARPRFGTVGEVAPGTEVRIADDGEVLLRGPGVMRGYHQAPDLTAEAIVDGWFHTGDLGELDAEGNLTLTDRKKDLMKTSGGKYVAPQKVEGALVAAIPIVSQAVAVGDGRNYISALLTLDADNAMRWAAVNGLADASYEEIVTSDKTREAVQHFVDRANASLERWETVKKFTILPHEFSVDKGEVTPSMKIRRSAIGKSFADEIDAMYDREDDEE